MQVVVNIDEDTYKDIKSGKIYTSVRDVPQESVVAIANGTLLPKRYNVDTLLQKATDEAFVQCKQFNERFSKDWNEGFNDGMFHTLTIIKDIIKADKAESEGEIPDVKV